MKNKKRLLLIALMTVEVSVYSQQQYDPEIDFRVEKKINGIGIIEYVGSKSIVRIPPVIQGLPVTSIGEYAFSRYTSLTSVIIPDSVTSIGSRAFYYCTNLTSTAIPDSVTSVRTPLLISTLWYSLLL